MAQRYNMRLVMKQRFSEFFEQKVMKERHRSLMMKMMALEVHLSNSQNHWLKPLKLHVSFHGNMD